MFVFSKMLVRGNFQLEQPSACEACFLNSNF
jgi:hypothetical protein